MDDASAPLSSLALPRRPWRGLRIGDLPKPILCVPLVFQWFWLGLRHGSLTLPSAVDPCIETGGLAGESKTACLAQIGRAFADSVAPWVLVSPGEDAVAARKAAALGFPLIAKPDIGWCGFGVRRIADDEALAAYQARFPTDAAFMLQRFESSPGEAGLFYERAPGAAHGHVTAITLRHRPFIVADGTRTLFALLVEAGIDAEAAGLGRDELVNVPAAGAQVTLTTVASIRVGASYEDATWRLNDVLDARVDAIARSMPLFHVGRFDVRFDALADLLDGRFSIIEVNGAGAEAIHLWDPRHGFFAAFAGVFAKQAMLFRHGAAMGMRGSQPTGVVALSRAWLRQQRLIAQYPGSN